MHFPNAMKLVAVKEMINLAPDPLVRQTIVQNFEREANILATLSHPSIPKIFDYFTHEERSYLVEEYIHGKDLEALLREAETFFSEDQVLAWMIELCDVLQYLHTHKPEPIIFRDMKPSNVMVNQQNHIMLVDFGIAKIFKSGQKGTMIGTEGYSPPEQYRGEATPQADVYAMGATIHHLLTRKDPRLEPPFTFSERPIHEINPAISPDLETVVFTALQYNPEDRYVSAELMKEALLSVGRKTGSLNRIRSQELKPVSSQSIKPIWVFESEDEIRGSPSLYRGMVYFGAYDNNLYAVNASNGEFAWKFPTDGGIVSRPLIDDDVIYFGSEDQRLYAISVRNARTIWVYNTEGAVRCSPRVAQGHVFTGSDDGGLHAINLLSQRRSWRLEASSPIRSTPFITNDFIYFGSEAGEIYCADFRGQLRWNFKAKRAITSSPLVENGAVFFSSLDGTFYSVEEKSGWPIWRFRMGKGSVSSPCKLDNYVYIGSADENIYCVDAGNSKEIWHFKTDHQVSGSPVVYKDALYCGSADGNLYCLEYKTGRLRWKFTTGGPITGTPAIYEDILYIGSSDHKLYALLT
jgi:outer membrane protein assembly factor BamB